MTTARATAKDATSSREADREMLEAVIQGPPDTVYQDGFFHLVVTIPAR